MLNLLTRIKAAWHITRNPPEPITVDSIYPMSLKHGTITYSLYSLDDPIVVPDATAIINEDMSITLISQGNITGWIPPEQCVNIISE